MAKKPLPNVDTFGRRGGPAPEFQTALNPPGGRGAGPAPALDHVMDPDSQVAKAGPHWHKDGSYSLRKK